MDFNIKLVTDDQYSECINHGQISDSLYTLEIPSGRNRTQSYTFCSGCLESLYNITKLGRQFGLNEFSPTKATISLPDKKKNINAFDLF